MKRVLNKESRATIELMIADDLITKDVAEKYFPELAESEDEKIKEEIINYFECQSRDEPTRKDIHNKWIAWIEKQGDKDEEILILKDQIESLHAAIKAVKETHKIELEKQGEQKSTNKVESKFKVGDTIYYNSFGEVKSMVVANVTTDSTDNPIYEDKDGNSVFQNDIIEQKLAWSKDDENRLKNLIYLVEHSNENKATKEGFIKFINRLKSLK